MKTSWILRVAVAIVSIAVSGSLARQLDAVDTPAAWERRVSRHRPSGGPLLLAESGDEDNGKDETPGPTKTPKPTPTPKPKKKPSPLPTPANVSPHT